MIDVPLATKKLEKKEFKERLKIWRFSENICLSPWSIFLETGHILSHYFFATSRFLYKTLLWKISQVFFIFTIAIPVPDNLESTLLPVKVQTILVGGGGVVGLILRWELWCHIPIPSPEFALEQLTLYGSKWRHSLGSNLVKKVNWYWSKYNAPSD